MNYVYPAVFYPEDNGTYSVIFPDLNNLATQGNDLSDALAMAEDVCSLYLFTSIRDGEIISKASSIKDIEKIRENDKAFINLILVDLNKYVKKYSNNAVKKTLSIPAWLNTICEENNINFSKVLQEALINKLQVNQ